MGKIWVLRSLIELNSKQVTCREKKGVYCWSTDEKLSFSAGSSVVLPKLFALLPVLMHCCCSLFYDLILVYLYSIELNFRYTDIISRHNEVLYQLSSSALRIFIILMLAFQLSWLYALMTNENIKLYTITELHVDTKDSFDHSWALLGSIFDLGAFWYTFSVTVVQLW